MHVIVLTVAFDELRAEVLADRSEDCGQVPDCKLGENIAPVLCDEDQNEHAVQKRSVFRSYSLASRPQTK